MAVPVRHSDILRAYVANASHPAWARDLVCLAVNTGGSLSDDDRLLIMEEIEAATAAPTQTLPAGLGNPYPKVELIKLTHHHGVNALADNQEITFCNEGLTLLYGQNRSGKSGYFRVLNQMAAGQIAYPVHQRLYTPAPAPISVAVEYTVDGASQSAFTWDGVSACPQELRHIRCFDSRYAAHFLEPRDGSTYLFESYSLKIFRAINDTLRYLKDELHVTVDVAVEASLTALCTASYRDTLKQSLLDKFREELIQLGMGDLNVNLAVDDLLAVDAKIAITIVNNMAVDSVLSEAELKCAAIALFLAECELMAVHQPIIFDDPVNSLDAAIIQGFAERLGRLDCEVVIFTHNVLLMEALTDGRRFKVFWNPATGRGGATTTKKHVLVYDVLHGGDRVGYVMGGNARKTKFYLDKADAALAAAGPLSELNHIVCDLRLAVEWAIDEVVFLGMAPQRFKGSKQINWDGMRSMASAGTRNIDDLKTNYDRLSNMLIHLGATSYTVTPTKVALQSIHDDILRIYNTI